MLRPDSDATDVRFAGEVQVSTRARQEAATSRVAHFSHDCTRAPFRLLSAYFQPLDTSHQSRSGIASKSSRVRRSGRLGADRPSPYHVRAVQRIPQAIVAAFL